MVLFIFQGGLADSKKLDVTVPRATDRAAPSLSMLSNKWRFGVFYFLPSCTQAQPTKSRRTVVVWWSEGVVGYPPSGGEYDKVSDRHSRTGRLGCQDSEDGRILGKKKK